MNNYYEENAREYIEETINYDMSKSYCNFLKYLHKDASIFDIGFGSGRDLIYFKSLGYSVSGIDIVKAFVDRMKEMKFDVTLSSLIDYESESKYDAIWACASLLHVKRSLLKDNLVKIFSLLNDNGIFYASFKYGDDEKEIGGRYFNFINEKIFNNMVNDLGFVLLEEKIEVDNNKGIKWISFILRKGNL